MDGIQQAVILASAPAGVALTSASHVQLADGDNLMAYAGGSTDIGAYKKITMTAGEAVSVFAASHGVKLYAGKGNVDVQAQSDELLLSALKDLHVTSADGHVRVTAKKSIVFTCAGAYIKIEGGNIEIGCPGEVRLKTAALKKTGAKSLSVPLPVMPTSDLSSAPRDFDLHLGDALGGGASSKADRTWRVVRLKSGSDAATPSAHSALSQKNWAEVLASGQSDDQGRFAGLTEAVRQQVGDETRRSPGLLWLVSGTTAKSLAPMRVSSGGDEAIILKTLDALSYTPESYVDDVLTKLSSAWVHKSFDAPVTAMPTNSIRKT
jgi:type VI secretion system secreted protein VgrG